MPQKRSSIKWRHLYLQFRSITATLLAFILPCVVVGVIDITWAQDPELPQNTFLVSYFRSQTTVPLFDTVISITNVNDGNCPVTIVWHANGSEALCLTESTIPANQTHHHCSSPNPATSGVTMVCHAICNGSTNSMEGHAIVQTAGTCGVRTGVDGKVYSATFMRNVDGRITETKNIGFHSVNVYRFDRVNLTE